MGSVTVWLDHDQLCVEYQAQSSWVLNATHLAVAASVADIPLNPGGNPQIGRFPYSQNHSPGVSEFTCYIDLKAAGLAEEPYLELAAQADVSHLSTDGHVLSQDGAWAKGQSFEDVLQAGPGGKGKGGNWAMHFGVDMTKLRIPPGLLLWNKLGSQYEVEHSVVGPNGVITGQLAYPPCKYGNGFEPMPRTGDHNTPDNYIEFSGLHLGQKGCIEFWYLPKWSDWSVGHIVELFTYGIPGSAPYTITMGYNDWQGLLSAVAFDYLGAAAYVQKSLVPSASPQWSTTSPVHVAVTWDGTQAVTRNRLTLYLNGVDSGTYYWSNQNPTFSNWDPASVLRMSARLSSGDWDRHPWEGNDGVFDNLKIWSYAKTDFSDRVHE